MTAEQQILALVCYISVALIRKIAKRTKMVFLTNGFTKKAEITILSARESTRPRLQAGALWVERKAYIRGSVARDSHLGL